MSAPFTGLLAYPITPLDDAGSPDLDVVAGIVGRAAAAGVDALTVLASSGDGRAFDAAERDAVVRAAVAAAGTVPVHVAVSAPSTRLVVEHARSAEREGAAGLVLTPFAYVPLVDAEVAALVRAVSAASELPLCFYNKPLQTGYDLTPALLADLARTTTLAAVKDPARLPGRRADRLDALRAAAGDDVALGLSGDVALTDDAPAADAWHTGLAALVPDEYVALRRARTLGASDTAPARWLLDVAQVLATTRPVPGLHALANLLGVRTGPPRGPWLPAGAEDVARLRDVVSRRPAR